MAEINFREQQRKEVIVRQEMKKLYEETRKQREGQAGENGDEAPI